MPADERPGEPALNPIDLVPLVAVVMGISVILVPVIGYTARQVLKPFQQSFARYLEARAAEDTVRTLERRLAFVEQQLDAMETTLSGLAEAADFDRRLRAPAQAAPAPRAATPLGAPDESRP